MTNRKGFMPVAAAHAVTPAWEWLPAEAITPKLGLCLTWDSSSGQLEVVDTGKPDYVCMCEAAAAITAGELIPVMKVDGWEFETVLHANDSGIKPGVKRDIYSGGLDLSTGTSYNHFQVTHVYGTSAGDAVRGYFV